MLKVTVFVPDVTEVVLEEQEPPKVTVPASEDEKLKSGVLLSDGVLIPFQVASIPGAVVSTTKVFTSNVLLALLAESVTVMVQLS